MIKSDRIKTRLAPQMCPLIGTEHLLSQQCNTSLDAATGGTGAFKCTTISLQSQQQRLESTIWRLVCIEGLSLL